MFLFCSCLSFPLFSNPHLCMCVYWFVYERDFRSGFDSALCLWLNVHECSCFGYCFDTVILFCLRLHVEVSVKLKTWQLCLYSSSVSSFKASQTIPHIHTITCSKVTGAGQSSKNHQNLLSCFLFDIIINIILNSI